MNSLYRRVLPANHSYAVIRGIKIVETVETHQNAKPGSCDLKHLPSVNLSIKVRGNLKFYGFQDHDLTSDQKLFKNCTLLMT